MEPLVELIALAKEIPEGYLGEALEKLKEIAAKAATEGEAKAESACPECGSRHLVRNGHKHRKQAYLCRDCGQSFVTTSRSAIENSHGSVTVWKQVIRDTVRGLSIDKTAENLSLSHATVFHMRHKILYALEQSFLQNPVGLSGVCETDETYVLESVKGRRIREDYHRKPRKHGAVASKRGLSEEYVCVCTSVTGEAKVISRAVNRAAPSRQEILEVFGQSVTGNTVILCDGNPSYNVLEDRCTVATTKRINKVNGFHRFIKERLYAARGVATLYLNRYNALFAKIYASDPSVAEDIFELMTSRTGTFRSISHTLTTGLTIL